MNRLRPIVHRDQYTRAVEAEVAAWFDEAIFAPLLALLDARGVEIDEKYQGLAYSGFGTPTQMKQGRTNAATSALVDALRSGRVQYADGVFSGRFSSAISAELRAAGAAFNATDKTFRLAPAKIPIELRGVLADAASKAAETGSMVDDLLRAAEANVAAAPVKLALTRQVEEIVSDLGRQFVSSVAAIGPADLGLAPTLSGGVAEQLEAELTRNLDLGIKGFAAERIPELRRRVQENTFKFGGRTDRLAKIIEAEFGVHRRKAEFLADQETGLLVSKYRKARYQSIGITDYTWSTSHDARVRPTHRALDGKRFHFSVGANVSEPGAPARYCNPGEDYRCRCVPIPLIDLKELAA